MAAIWLLSTRGRPSEAQETIDACQQAGMTSQGVVYIDEDTGLYDNLRLPRNWTVHREPKWLSLQGSMSWCFKAYPDATHYGWLADDNRPRTPGWDKKLEAAAGRWGLVCARDLWMSEDPISLDRIRKGQDLTAGLCWGGDLVRTVGWWALPDVRQAGIDTAWYEIASALNLHRYVESVVVEHLNWRTGKRPKDKTDDWVRRGDNYIERDIAIRDRWVWSRAFRDLLTLLATAIHRGITYPPLLYALAKSEADEKLRTEGGIRPQIIVRLLELERAAFEYQRLHPDEKPPRLDPPLLPVRPEPDLPGLGARDLRRFGFGADGSRPDPRRP